MSEYYAVVRSTDHLAHYGVVGMKWGVRRYVNKYGNITKAGINRYGDRPRRKTSARKMQRDYNRLDISRANVYAEGVDAKRNLNKKSSELSDFVANSKKKHVKISRQMTANVKKNSASVREKELQLAGIEDLQRLILERAEKSGYKVKRRNVSRKGWTTQDSINAAQKLHQSKKKAMKLAYDPEKQISGTAVKIKKKRR